MGNKACREIVRIGLCVCTPVRRNTNLWFSKYLFSEKNMKKICIVLLFIFSTASINGEELEKNVIYGGISASPVGIGYGIGFLSPQFLFGLNLEYERLFNEMFSLALDIGIDPVLTPYAEIKGRWYPRSNIFYLGLGTGIWGFIPLSFINNSAGYSITLSPTIGWRINTGQNIEWVVMPNITNRFLLYRNNSEGHYFAGAVGEWLRVNIGFGYKF